MTRISFPQATLRIIPASQPRQSAVRVPSSLATRHKFSSRFELHPRGSLSTILSTVPLYERRKSLRTATSDIHRVAIFIERKSVTYFYVRGGVAVGRGKFICWKLMTLLLTRQLTSWCRGKVLNLYLEYAWLASRPGRRLCWGFSWFSSVPPCKFWVTIYIRPQPPLHSKSFQIYH